jgi:hypothetical protein
MGFGKPMGYRARGDGHSRWSMRATFPKLLRQTKTGRACRVNEPSYMAGNGFTESTILLHLTKGIEVSVCFR